MLSTTEVSANEPRKPDDLMRGRILRIEPTRTGICMEISDERDFYGYAFVHVEDEHWLNVGDNVTVEFYNFEKLRYPMFNWYRDNRTDAKCYEIIYKNNMTNLGDILNTKGKALLKCNYSDYGLKLKID